MEGRGLYDLPVLVSLTFPAFPLAASTTWGVGAAVGAGVVISVHVHRLHGIIPPTSHQGIVVAAVGVVPGVTSFSFAAVGIICVLQLAVQIRTFFLFN